MLTLRWTMCAIYTAYRVWWEVIDVVHVVAAQAVGRGLWQEDTSRMEILYNPITVKLRFLRGVWMVSEGVWKCLYGV